MRSCSRDITTTSFLPLGRNQFGNQKTRKRKQPEAKLFSNSPGFLASELSSSEGGEDRNRTYPGPQNGPTTVLKTARATRHRSLSGKRIRKPENQEKKGAGSKALFQLSWLPGFGIDLLQSEGGEDGNRIPSFPGFRAYFAFLICLTTSSKSGHSPVSSLEWSFLPLAVTSKAPPLEGTSVSDAIRSPRSSILVAKLTAFGV